MQVFTRAVGGTALLVMAFSLPLLAADNEPSKPNPVANAVANTMGKLRADDDMLAVLKAHASLNPKAIGKSDVTTARANPTIADAVNVVLKNRGKSTRPQDLVLGVTSLDTTIQGAAGMLPARIYTPQGSAPFPVVLYFHGGGWVLADKQVYDGGAARPVQSSGSGRRVGRLPLSSREQVSCGLG